jgi:HSP20 family protein
LEDHGKDYLLKAEMPGFKKDDIEIEAQDDSIAITGKMGWKYDEKKPSIHMQGASLPIARAF